MTGNVTGPTWRSLVWLVLLGAGAAAALAAVAALTEPRIQEARLAAAVGIAASLGVTGADRVHAARWLAGPAADRPLCFADGSRLERLVAAGYGGDIVLLARRAEQLSALRVVRHKETPGLGDFIEHGKTAWITQFDGIGPHDLAALDGRSGATITANAVHQAAAAVLAAEGGCAHDTEGAG